MTVPSSIVPRGRSETGKSPPAAAKEPSRKRALGETLRRAAILFRLLPRRMRVNTRLMLVVSAIVIAIIALVGVSGFSRYDRERHYAERDARFLGHLNRVAEIINQRVEFHRNAVDGLLRIAPRDPAGRPIISSLTEQLEAVNGATLHVVFFDKWGLVSEVGTSDAASAALSWLATKAARLGKTQVEAIGSSGNLAIASHDVHGAAGTLVVVMSGEWLRAEIVEHGSSSPLAFELRDSTGDILADVPSASGSMVALADHARDAVILRAGRVVPVDEIAVAAVLRLESVDWELFAVEDVKEVLRLLRLQSWVEAALFIALPLMPLAFIYWLIAVRFYKPIEELKAWAVACGEGELTRRLGWSKRTTDLADLGRVMDQMAAKLDRETKARSQFFAQMSHEIRTPMNAIIGFTRLLLQGRDINEAQREQLLMIRSSGESLLTIINDLLDFAKAEAGKLALLPVPFRTSALLKSVVAMMESLARGKGLDLRLNLTVEHDREIVADETRIRQVLVNLIGNAVKFTERGFVEVKASLAQESETVGRVTIVVSDTGPGLDKAVANLLFSPYSQANIEISRKFGGTGLGLALCRQLADLMEGQLSVNSAVGVGTSFVFSFPITFESQKDLRTEVQETAFASQPRHVLLVEDQFINQRLAIAILERAGHRVTLASSGVEAISHTRAVNFDVILMDIQMPEMDGIAASKSIRAMGGHNAAVPIIAVTAQALPDEIEKCLAAGMTEYVAKPIDERQLLVSIQRLTADASGAPVEVNGGSPAVAAACPHLNMAVVEQVEISIGREDAIMLWEKLAVLLDELLAEAPVALGSGNLTGLAANAHKLVGAAGALGAGAASDLCRAIEQDAKAGGTPELPRRMAKLSRIAAETLEAINRLFSAQIKLSSAREAAPTSQSRI